MEESTNKNNGVLRFLSYVLVAVLASVITLLFAVPTPQSAGTQLTVNSGKLQQLEDIILNDYVGEADKTLLEDAAAHAMVLATGDKWSYYIPASDLKAHQEQRANAYVGVGITIIILEDNQGFDIQKVEPNGPAKAAGLLPGDVVVAVNGQRITDIGSDAASNMVSGEEGTDVDITVRRGEEELTVTITRSKILTVVAQGQMVSDTVGYIRINNFDDRCAQETIALYEQLEQQGAEAFVFDVRFNPGGYKHELVKILDFLLPEGILFRSQFGDAEPVDDVSDAACKQAPMAVLINGESYSAAEFFAAALEEYDYAVTVGEATTGKGYFQTTFNLRDGSAVNLSVGKYYTPKGVSLAEVGGLVPEIAVAVDEETAALIYGELLPLEEDVQLQAAVAALEKKEN